MAINSNIGVRQNVPGFCGHRRAAGFAFVMAIVVCARNDTNI